MGLFGKISKQPNLEKILDQELYRVPTTDTSISWADSLEGTLITGATGSGKTSAIGKYVGQAMLNKGFGMVIFCAKKEERERWEAYIEDCGRTEDKIVFNKASGLKFNFLKYELDRDGDGSGDVLNALNILMNLNEQSRIYQSGNSGNKDERFWDESLRRLISRTIALLRLAGEEVSIYNMRKIVVNCFRDEDSKRYFNLTKLAFSNEQIDKRVKDQAFQDLTEWKSSNYFVEVIDMIISGPYYGSEETDVILDYWLKEFANISDKTASIIIESYMGCVEAFIGNGILKDQFSQGLSKELAPESIIKGKKILIIDFPVKEFGLSAIYAATIYKTAFQNACERRNLTDETDPKPIGLFIDEYQSFCNPVSDSLFQATARSSWVACVYITQNINNLFFVMGDSQPQARAYSLLGNLNLKYFANNADITTNEWASNLIGKHWIDVYSSSYNKDSDLTKSKSMQFHYKVTPDHFTTLKTGRKENGHKVQALVFKPGKLWDDKDSNFAIVEFKQ